MAYHITNAIKIYIKIDAHCHPVNILIVDNVKIADIHPYMIVACLYSVSLLIVGDFFLGIQIYEFNKIGPFLRAVKEA